MAAVTGSDSRAAKPRLRCIVDGDRSPNDLYVLRSGHAALTRLTTSLSPQIDAEDLVDAQIVRFKARDGMTIPNILWKPHQATASNKAPALVWVHGGPGGQTTPSYSAVIQYLVNHGYVVLGINNRGSSGYGKTFFAADDKKHGREPLWDCVDGKKYLQSLDYVDPHRIGIIGGSYGGYMVLAALAFQPDEFNVGVDMFGVANWIRTLESIPSWWEAQRDGALRRVGRPGEGPQDARGGVAAPARGSDPQTAAGAAGRQRSARAEGRVRRGRRGGEEERRDRPSTSCFPTRATASRRRRTRSGYSAVLRFLDQYLKAARQAATGTDLVGRRRTRPSAP